MAKAQTVKLVDNPIAPELFATAATGFSVCDGTVTITLESLRADHSISPGPVYRTVVGRVTLPSTGAQGLAIGLFEFLQKQGFEFKKPQ